MYRIDCHLIKTDEDSAPHSILDLKNSLNWNGDLANPHNSEDDCNTEDESDIEPHNCIQDSESPEHWVLSAARNVSGLIRPTLRSMNKAEKGLMTVSVMDTRRNNGNKKK